MSNTSEQRQTYRALKDKDILQLRITALEDAQKEKLQELKLLSEEKQSAISELAVHEKDHLVIQEKRDLRQAGTEDILAQWEAEDLEIAEQYTAIANTKLSALEEKEQLLRQHMHTIASKIAAAQQTLEATLGVSNAGSRFERAAFALALLPVTGLLYLVLQLGCDSLGARGGLWLATLVPMTAYALMVWLACHKQVNYRFMTACALCGVSTLTLMLSSWNYIENMRYFAYNAKDSANTVTSYGLDNFTALDANKDGILEMDELDTSIANASLVRYFYEIGHAFRYEVNSAGKGRVHGGELHLQSSDDISVKPIYGISKTNLLTYPMRIREKYKNW